MKKNTSKKKQKKPPLGNGKNNEIIVYIFNVVEDEWSFLSTIQPIEKRYEKINSSNMAAECYLFANASADNFFYISPIEIPENFKNYFLEVVGKKNFEIFVPQMKTGLICKDLYTDKSLFSDLINKLRKYDKIKLISYAASPEFLELKERLIQLGLNVITPEAPDLENAWTVNFYGSKSGIRQLAQQSKADEPDFIMPEGIICVGRLDAAKIAANTYLNDKGVVLKTNKGSGGDGVLIFREGELPNDYKMCEKRIYELLSEDGYWERYPIIIEKLINVDYRSFGAFPNIEFKIHRNGKIEMLYYCVMMVTKEGKYYGLDIHEDVLNERIATRITDTGYYIAEKYAEEGYRGHFDVDMISAKGGKIYVSESNTRNTGGTDIYKLTKYLFGEDFFSDVYVLNRNNYKFKTKKNHLTFERILEVTKPILFNKKTKEGLVISSSISIIEDKKLLYTIYGKNKKRAYQLEQELFKLLEKIN
ncbi:MAG: hypothetical protein NZM02_01365 [Patescibacteria group bacterium]|nr:hypothetical protein [Patescibacteria group bacterium]